MKKNVIFTMAVWALMACGNKSENNGATGAADSTVAEQTTVVADVPQAESEEQSEDDELLLGKQSWKVDGGVSVKNFCCALLPGYHEFFAEDPANIKRFFEEDEGTVVVDEKNGYLSSFSEGAGSENIEVCYWKRTDGSILVAFASDVHDWDYSSENMERLIKKSTINFFIYDKDNSLLVPCPTPFNLNVGADKHVTYSLPQNGKDIEYYVSNADDYDDNYENGKKVLKFNGMTFE